MKKRTKGHGQQLLTLNLKGLGVTTEKAYFWFELQSLQPTVHP
jgi:hypothetical protein